MSAHEDQIRLCQELTKYESGLAHLYGIYARKFPEHFEFWDGISLEESTHAFLLKNFLSLLEDKTIRYAPRPFKAADIAPYIKELSDIANDALRNELDLCETLLVARELEDRVLEKEMIKPYDDDSPELKKILSSIQSDTQGHARRLRDFYSKIMAE